MLHQLNIENYAIIDSLEIGFPRGLNIITGETGAGKSILMGALSLILGERADTTVLADQDKKCFIEGIFKDFDQEVKFFLKENDLDCEEDLIIRREISSNGKSRAFINDTPATLAQLKQLTSFLVDLHQQFDTLELSGQDFQREVIDALASHSKELEQYQHTYKSFTECRKELQQLKDEQELANKDLDYNQFLYNELQDANFTENELENIETEIKMMSNAENIKDTLSEIYFELEESEKPMVQEIKLISNRIKVLEKFHPGFTSLVARLESVLIEMRDIASEIEEINRSVQFDAEKINLLNDRMAEGYRLLKKHSVSTTSQLLEIKEKLSGKLRKITDLSSEILAKEKAHEELQKAALQLANTISSNRAKQIKPFETKVNTLLKRVGMPNARLKVSLETAEELNQFGNNTIEFLFNANVPVGKDNRDIHFESLRKVASGGELSRLMLTIKSLVAKSVQMPTLIFDEIDSGISGEAARQVGIILKELSANHQVVSITHQPQIAARADTHFFVYKEIRNNKIATSIKPLDRDERITTIAVMLSGEKPTAAAFENAREMIRN
jgi:DNA repair protein RecN (Recombination protein N)